jgi:hypothetical protein
VGLLVVIGIFSFVVIFLVFARAGERASGGGGASAATLFSCVELFPILKLAHLGY